jgi:hypothetical protein
LLVPIAVLLSAVWQGLLTFPNADDFCFAREGEALGPYGAMLSYYQRWTGRLSSSFLIAAIGGVPGSLRQFYWVSSIVVLLGYLLGTAYALRRLGILSARFAIVACSLILAGVSWRESVFWLSGAGTYAFGSIICIFLWAEYWRIAVLPSQTTKRRIALVAIFTFIAGMFNEPLAIAQIVLISGLLVISWSRARRVSFALVLFAIVAVTALLVVVVAPGNNVREANFERIGIFAAAYRSLGWMMAEHFQWMLSVYVVITCAAMLLRVRIHSLSRKELICVAGLLLTTAWAAIFVRYYAVGASGPVRAWTVEITALFFAVFFMSQASLCTLSESLENEFSKSNAISWLMASAAAVTMLHTPTPDNETLRASIGAARYSKRVHVAASERFAQLAQSKPTDHVELNDLPFKSKALTSFWDIGGNADEGQNRCMAAYFNVASVKLKVTSAKSSTLSN